MLEGLLPLLQVVSQQWLVGWLGRCDIIIVVVEGTLFARKLTPETMSRTCQERAL